MDRIEKHILVDAPIPSVFRFVNEPFNLLRIFPDLIEVTSVVRLKNGGRNFQCVSKMADSRIQYTNECIEYVQNQSVTYRLSGGLHGSIRWSFETQNELTQIRLILEYEAPAPLLKHHTEAEIARRNEHSVQQLLCNLKTVLERQSLVQK